MVPKDPKLVYLQIPDEFLPPYHWFKVDTILRNGL